MNTNTNAKKLLKRLVETKAETIKLGLDLHARDVVVCVQPDGELPQRPQKLTAAELLALATGLVAGVARDAARRKLAVAAARKLAVDRWRLATKQTTPEKLHLLVPAEVPA